MELYQQMIVKGLERGTLQISLTDQAQKWLEGECYQALQRIRSIIKDDLLDDQECFMKIEEIILTLEELGSSGGTRHDFG